MTLNPEVDALLDVLNRGYPPVHEMTAADARAVLETRRQPVLNVDDVASAEDRVVAGVRVRIYQPHRESAGAVPLIVFAHGGGFVLCDLESHDSFCRAMAKGCGAVVVSVDYRRAPDAVAPAAADDVYAVLGWAAEAAASLDADPERIVLAGDSAGGNLAAVAALMALERGGPSVAAQVLLYPVIDPACDSESYQRFGSGYFNTLDAMRWYWAQYLEGSELPPTDPHVNPMRAASLAGLPPAIVVAPGRDPLYSEGVAYGRALEEAGVPVIVRAYPEVLHGFVTNMAFTPGESARTLLWSDLARVLGGRRG